MSSEVPSSPMALVCRVQPSKGVQVGVIFISQASLRERRRALYWSVKTGVCESILLWRTIYSVGSRFLYTLDTRRHVHGSAVCSNDSSQQWLPRRSLQPLATEQRHPGTVPGDRAYLHWGCIASFAMFIDREARLTKINTTPSNHTESSYGDPIPVIFL